VLQVELHYPEDKALQFVRRFDRNNDGHLSSLEFNAMRRKITETSDNNSLFSQYLLRLSVALSAS